MEKHPSGIKRESWIVLAGRVSEPGTPLNVPLILASEDADDLWADLDSAIGSVAP
jgi:hypothetical protein